LTEKQTNSLLKLIHLCIAVFLLGIIQNSHSPKTEVSKVSHESS